MPVDTKIPLIDKQGEGERVLTDYQIHTISIVGEGALGVNLSKVKSQSQRDFLETDKGKELMSKVNKAKALDEDEKADLENVEENKGGDENTGDEKPADETPVVEGDEKPTVEGDETPVVEPEVTEDEKPVVEDDEKPVVEDDEKPADVEGDEAPEVTDTVVDEVTDKVVDDLVDGEGDEPVHKAKSFTSSEVIQAQKDALDGVHKLVEKIMAALPDAAVYEVTDLVYSAIWKVEDAIYDSQSSVYSDIYSEVYEEVNSRVNKAKALKLAEDGTLEQKLKSLESTNPELAVLFKAQADELATSRAKALDAENETKAVLRAKALAHGAEQFKRIATDDNSTDNIVDAMAVIAISDPESHKVIAKALDTAAAITMGGELFQDMGSTSNAELPLGEEEYVEVKAKALTDADGSLNPAAARANVRLTPEFQVLYG